MRNLERGENMETTKEFIKYFGKEKLYELKVSNELQIELNKICKTYLCDIEPIPIVFDNTIKSTAIYHFELNAIILHPKNINNRNRLLTSMLHELEHYCQWIYVNNFKTNKAKKWAKEIQNYNTTKEHYYNQEIEIDAIAFSQIIMQTEYNITVELPNKKIQNKINKYKQQLLED